MCIKTKTFWKAITEQEADRKKKVMDKDLEKELEIINPRLQQIETNQNYY